jgi:hypothetical protein
MILSLYQKGDKRGILPNMILSCYELKKQHKDQVEKSKGVKTACVVLLELRMDFS